MNTLTKTPSRGRYGRKDASSTPAPNAGETREAFLTRCTTKDWTAEKLGPVWDAKQTKTEPDNDVTLKQLEDTVTKSVTAALGKMSNGLNEEAIRKIIKDELATAALDSKKLTAEQVSKLASDASQKAFDEANRKDGKQLMSKEDATGRSQIEIPFSLRKGNLPLHMKQLVNVLCRKEANVGIDDADLRKGSDLEEKFWSGVSSHGTKALTTSGDGTGSEWIPRTLSSELYRRLYLESQIAQAFLSQEVQMPTDPYDYPLLTTDPVFTLNNAQNTNAGASDPVTSKFTLTTARLMALCQFSYEANEDSIIPLLPMFQMTIARAGARALETAILNGDTTSTHFDTGYTVALNDARRAWKGLRKLATAGSLTVDMSTGGVSRANLLSIVGLMGKWGVRTQDLLWVVGTKGWARLLGLDEVALAYASGRGSSYIQGGPTPAPWGGMIAVSEQIDEQQTSAGIFDNSTKTKGQIVVLNKAGFVFGSRREFMLEVDRNIKSQTHEVVASFRKAFQPVETPSTTISTVAMGINYTA